LIWRRWRVCCMNIDSNYLIKHSVYSGALRESLFVAISHWTKLRAHSTHLPRFKMCIFQPTPHHSRKSTCITGLWPDLFSSLQHCMDIHGLDKIMETLQTLYTFLYWHSTAAIILGMDFYKFWTASRAVGLERGPLSLVNNLRSYLEETVAAPGLENRSYDRRDTLRWTRDTLYLLKLALTSLTGGDRSIGIVR
jgi:hypothetical protein